MAGPVVLLAQPVHPGLIHPSVIKVELVGGLSEGVPYSFFGWFVPSKQSVSDAIHDRILALKAELGELGDTPNFVTLTPQEYQMLKAELQAKGEILSINGVALMQVEPQESSLLKPKKDLIDTAIDVLNKVTMHEVMSEPTIFNIPPLLGDFLPLPLPKVYHTSKKDDWRTPQAFFDRCKSECAFDLDVCADLNNAKCDLFFSEQQNALEMEWFGKVWMNPPYSLTGKFLQKLIEELQAGRIEKGWALVAARTDTKWFQAASCYTGEIRFLKGRLQFEAGGPLPEKPQSAPFPSALLIFDKTIQEQGIMFWDWKLGVKTVYAYAKTKPYAKGLASLVEKSGAKKSLMSGFLFPPPVKPIKDTEQAGFVNLEGKIKEALKKWNPVQE